MNPKTAAGMAARAEYCRQSPGMPDWDAIAGVVAVRVLYEAYEANWFDLEKAVIEEAAKLLICNCKEVP